MSRKKWRRSRYGYYLLSRPATRVASVTVSVIVPDEPSRQPEIKVEVVAIEMQWERGEYKPMETRGYFYYRPENEELIWRQGAGSVLERLFRKAEGFDEVIPIVKHHLGRWAKQMAKAQDR